jgi:hypothetical protein
MPAIRSKTGYPWNVLLVVGSVVGALLLGEGILALLQSKPLRVNHRDFYEYDPQLGWKKKANATRVNVTEEFRAAESTNSKGIRGGEYAYTKHPAEYRLLILGDSFAEGYSVVFEDLFSEVLKTALNSVADNTSYEVINAATVGYGTDQELIFYKDEGYKYKPDLVIVMFYENDVIDNVTRREIYGNYKPVFNIQDNRLILVNPAATEHASDVKPSVADGRGDVDHRLKNRSRIYSLLETALTNWGLIGKEIAAPPTIPKDFRVLSKEPDAEIVNAWKVTEMLLVELKKTVQDSGARLLVFFVPSVHTVDSNVFEATKKKYEVPSGLWSPLEVESNLVRICNEHSIDCIPTIARFKEEARSMGKDAGWFYFPRDAHWNIRGHRLVGKILSDYILSHIRQSSGSNSPSESESRAAGTDRRE